MTQDAAKDLVQKKVGRFRLDIADLVLGQSQVDWLDIASRVLEREAVVKTVKDSLETGGAVSALVSYEIATTDIFVQKAEGDLRHRSRSMAWLAGISGLITIAAIMAYAALLAWTDAIRLDYAGAYQFTGSIVRGTVITGLFLGLIYLLVSLFRAFLHEWTTLENRAHSLRLGRLYIYLKYVSVTDSAEVSGIRKALDANDLERVFGWNIETSTAFKDIRPELVSRNLLSQLVESLGKAISRKT